MAELSGTSLEPGSIVRVDGGRGKKRTVEAIANKKSGQKQMLMVGTYMKQIKRKGHKKLLRRYTKKIGKWSLGFLNGLEGFQQIGMYVA